MASLLRELDDDEKRAEAEIIIRETFGAAYIGESPHVPEHEMLEVP